MTIVSPAAQTATVVVEENAEYTDRTLATASWWDRYELVAGEYPIEFTTVGGYPARDFDSHADGSAYYARVRIPAVLVESFRVNRLFTASSAHTERPNREEVVHLSCYAYQVKDGMVLVSADAPTEENRWAKRPVVTIRFRSGGAQPAERTIATAAPQYAETAGLLF
jgi:hypothetical protein